MTYVFFVFYHKWYLLTFIVSSTLASDDYVINWCYLWAKILLPCLFFFTLFLFSCISIVWFFLLRGSFYFIAPIFDMFYYWGSGYYAIYSQRLYTVVSCFLVYAKKNPHTSSRGSPLMMFVGFFFRHLLQLMTFVHFDLFVFSMLNIKNYVHLSPL